MKSKFFLVVFLCLLIPFKLVNSSCDSDESEERSTLQGIKCGIRSAGQKVKETYHSAVSSVSQRYDRIKNKFSGNTNNLESVTEGNENTEMPTINLDYRNLFTVQNSCGANMALDEHGVCRIIEMTVTEHTGCPHGMILDRRGNCRTRS